MKIFCLVTASIALIACNERDSRGSNKIAQISEGIHFTYHTNGNVKEAIHYKNGVKNGDLFFYNEEGRLYYKQYYRDGKKDGLYAHFYPNGNINYTTMYHNDIDSGQFIVWYYNGMVKQIGQNDKGKNVGSWLIFDSLGRLIEQKFYSIEGVLLRTDSLKTK